MARMKNTPQTVSAAKSLAGTTWAIGDNFREIVRVENAELSRYDNSTIMADIFWRKPGAQERKDPTPLTTFRTWLNKAELVSRLN